jgi:hypothetical protein
MVVDEVLRLYPRAPFVPRRVVRASERAGLPAAAIQASLGCGNPLAVADLHSGDTPLDLDSGGGIDVLLSARGSAPPAGSTAWT